MNMTPDELLRKCTVRIATSDTLLGTGFFVGPGLVLTCAHVVVEPQTCIPTTHFEVQWGKQCCNATIVDFKCNKITVGDVGWGISYYYPDYYQDLALLRVTFPGHPCVLLSDDDESPSVDRGDKFQSFGYTLDFPDGDSFTFGYEGTNFIQDKPFLKLNAGRAVAGLSGAPLLLSRTHRISGVVQTSFGDQAPVGGRAIPTRTLFETFPQVKEVQKEYRLSPDNPWLHLLTGKDHGIKETDHVSTVPYQRNPLFMGRDKVLTDLHTELTKTEEALPRAIAITGLSGVGKTQIALEYAYRYGSEYRAVFWVRADPDAARVDDLVKIAWELRLQEAEKNDQDKERIVDAVRRWLREHQGWLLILDHVEKGIESLCEFFCSGGGGGHILLTTQAQIRGKPVKSIGIEKMGAEEGALLLLRGAGRLTLKDPIEQASEDDRVNANAIVTAMDSLPLALEQAAAYINESRRSLQEYLSLFISSPLKVLYSGHIEHESVAKTFSLSFDKVEKANPAAADLLRFCAFLYPDAIPVDQIIVKGAPELGPNLQSVPTNPIQLDEALEELQKFSLVRDNPTAKTRTLTVHRLVQEVLRDSMDKETLRLWLERTVRALNRAFPAVEYQAWAGCEQCLPHVQECLKFIQLEGITWIEVTQLLNKAGSYLRERAQFAQALELITQVLTSRKSILAEEATSLHTMALLSFKQGHYDQAEPYYLSALNIRKTTLGPTDPATATSLNDLAGLYNSLGRFIEAEKLCKQGLEIRENVLGHDHPDTARSLNDLGCIYYEQGKYDQAEQSFRRALDIRKRVLGPKNPDTATSMNNLARLYYSQGRYNEALSYYQKALNIRLAVLITDHPDTANSLNDLAHLYYRLARYEEAEPLYGQARDAWTYILGSEPVHPAVATIYHNLAKLYYRLGNYQQAEAYYLQALEIMQRTLDGRLIDVGNLLPDCSGRPRITALPEHPAVATTLNGLGRLYFGQGKYDVAEKVHQQALAMRKKLLDPGHPDIAESLNYLGILRYKQARYSESESYYIEAHTIRQDALGLNHPAVAETLNNLGWLYYRLGQYVKAKSCYRKALKIREQVLGPKHPDTATTLSYLAKLYSRQGKFKHAERLFQRARTAWESHEEKKLSGFVQSPDRATMLHDLASLYTDLGRFAQAEGLYQQALAIRKQVLGPESPDTASSYHHLGWLYYNQGKYVQARKYYRQALSIRKKALGEEHPYVADTLDNLARLYFSQGKYKQAAPLYQRALEIRKQTLGEKHPYTAYSFDNLGRLYSRQARYKEAESRCKRSKEIREEVLGPGHPDTALSLTDLAWIYNDLAKYDQAKALFEQALAIRESALPPGHSFIADSCNDLAKFYTKWGKEKEGGDYAQAEQLYQRALKIREPPGPENSKVAETLNDQATLFFKQKKYAQAESNYQRALAIREEVLGPDHPYTADSLNDTAKFYAERGDGKHNYKRAEELYQRARAIREEALGPEHPKVAETLYGLAKLSTKQEKYEQAELLYQRALAIMKEVLGPDHPDVLQISKDYEDLLRKTNREAQAIALGVRQ